MMARLPSGERNGYKAGDDAVNVRDNGKIANVGLICHKRSLPPGYLLVRASGS